MKNHKKEEVLEVLRAFFVDFENPDYEVLKKKLDSKIHNRFIHNLKLYSKFKITEDTDNSYMVCRYFYLETKKGISYSLYLSNYGLYALIVRKKEHTRNKYIALTKENQLYESDIELIDILEEFNYEIFSKELLDSPIRYDPKHAVDYDYPTLYNILFAEDIPPW